MARDVAGVSRANMFEVLTASDGTRFTPTGGTARHITYKGSDGSTVTTSNHRRSGDELKQVQAMQAEYPAATWMR